MILPARRSTSFAAGAILAFGATTSSAGQVDGTYRLFVCPQACTVADTAEPAGRGWLILGLTPIAPARLGALTAQQQMARYGGTPNGCLTLPERWPGLGLLALRTEAQLVHWQRVATDSIVFQAVRGVDYTVRVELSIHGESLIGRALSLPSVGPASVQGLLGLRTDGPIPPDCRT